MRASLHEHKHSQEEATSADVDHYNMHPKHAQFAGLLDLRGAHCKRIHEEVHEAARSRRSWQQSAIRDTQDKKGSWFSAVGALASAEHPRPEKLPQSPSHILSELQSA